MRLFVAADIGPAVREAAARLAAELRQRVLEQAPRARVTWTRPDRLHLTVAFIGEVPGERQEAFHDALAPALPQAPFALRVEGVGVFPPRGAPRVVWAGVGRGREALLGVVQAVRGRLRPLARYDAGDEAFRPHLTLARVRQPAGLRSRDLLHGLDDVVLGTAMVEAVTLYESRLSPDGPVYVPLCRTPLAGPAAEPARSDD